MNFVFEWAIIIGIFFILAYIWGKKDISDSAKIFISFGFIIFIIFAYMQLSESTSYNRSYLEEVCSDCDKP